MKHLIISILLLSAFSQAQDIKTEHMKRLNQYGDLQLKKSYDVALDKLGLTVAENDKQMSEGIMYLKLDNGDTCTLERSVSFKRDITTFTLECMNSELQPYQRTVEIKK